MAVNINIPSQVSQTITDGVTDKAPSEDAVFDALALKANTGDLGNYVPYTGATTDVNLGTYNLTADHINLNVSPSGAGFVVGSTQWNNTIGSSETLLKGGNVTLKNGVDLVARVVNKVVPNTTLTKAQYQAVKVSGATGGRLSVGLAQANTDLNSADTIGLVTETIATNQEGFIITVGQIEDINTTGSLQGETWADGDVLYLSPTVAGKLTNIKPTGATGHIVVIGYVEYSHANNGKIYVKIMNGWELDELHNVNITSPTGGAVLEYQASTQLWIDSGIQYTIELIAALTVDFYAPYNLVITSVSNVLNAPTITIQDDNVAYTLGNTITAGSKITVTGSVASVVNLNITK
jgi:nitrogen fixation protein